MAIDMDEINKEIDKLENAETNWKNCEKLHILYGVRDSIVKDTAYPEKEMSYSYASSEFTKIAYEVPKEHLISVLDEHIEAIKVIYPKEYRLIIKKLLDS